MDNRIRSYPKANVIVAAIGVLSLTTVLALSPTTDRTGRVELPVTLAVAASEPPPPAQTDADAMVAPAAEATEATDQTEWVTVIVRPGDNLSNIFKRQGMPAADLQKIMALGNKVAQLRSIVPGQEISFGIAESGELNQLRYSASPVETLLVSRVGSLFIADRQVAQPEIFTTLREGEITSDNPSLFLAGKAAGLSDALIMELSYVFQWDISFALDLRHGDRFSVLYQEKYLQGEKIGDGDILAATFTNLGKTYRAVRYVSDNGASSYYTPAGENLRKAFLRDPIHFSYISSNFNLKRLHPIQKRVMPHLGTDFVAPRGTPVKASGDGVVTIARQNAASGKYIVLQHGEQFETKYLHLSRFARGIRPGKRVKQGEVIGYVGSTGWATAPHLHYEFLVNGVHRNPRTVTLPNAAPVPAAERSRFLAQISPYLVHLENYASANGDDYSGE